MAEEYTPTWDAIREGYAQGSQRVGITYERGLAEADSWLAAHDAQVKAEALREDAVQPNRLQGEG